MKFYLKTITDETKLAHNAELHDMGKQSWITTIEKICTTATNQSHSHEHRKSSAVITGQISGSIFQEDSKPHWHQQHFWQQTTNIRKNKKRV